MLAGTGHRAALDPLKESRGRAGDAVAVVSPGARLLWRSAGRQEAEMAQRGGSGVATRSAAVATRRGEGGESVRR